MMKMVCILGTMVYCSFLLSSFSLAQHSHGGHGEGTPGETMKMDTREVLVEEMKITFMIMANEEHRKMLRDMNMKEDIEKGTTHNITLSLKDAKTDKEITDARISIKVIDPMGKAKTKTLKYEEMMKSYDSYFDLSEKGRYQIIVLVKRGNKKTQAGIYYDIK
jgi:hypothetical protein